MGSVYKIWDTKLEKFWALKEMIASYRSHQERQEIMERFKREAQILSNLHHPSLPRVIDYFSEGGRQYLVMDFIEGETVEEYQKRVGMPGLPEEPVRDIALQTVEVLEYLHEQNPPVLYRDLKPSNLMRRQKDGKIFLIDFGIIKVLRLQEASTGTSIGSEGYAPPEQYRGRSEPRSDIYSLGATMHHLLCGQAPPGPFHFDPIPGISSWMQGILDRALQLKPEDRFGSAAEMRTVLEKKEILLATSGKRAKESQRPVTPLEPAILVPFTGTYTEVLPCGGKLSINGSTSDWWIEYYFSGPDLRYSGTFVKIPGEEIESYIQAYLDNWVEYVQLKKTIPEGGEYTKEGRLGMTIRIGGWNSGVCIRGYHMPISTKEQLERQITSYKYAIERAKQILEPIA
jgi:serine/threonine protein kinase